MKNIDPVTKTVLILLLFAAVFTVGLFVSEKLFPAEVLPITSDMVWPVCLVLAGVAIISLLVFNFWREAWFGKRANGRLPRIERAK
jgi:hypothetical protein